MNQLKQKSHRARKLGAVVALGVGVALSSGASAEVLLSSQSGWDLSVDGSVNNFLVHQTYGAKELSAGGEARATSSTTRVRSGLLPAVLGVNIKAPTVRGLNMVARFGFYPHTQNDNIVKDQFSGQIDFREVFFKVDGKFGSVLVGKTLSLFLGKNILNDMTLLGVGAGTDGAGTTTLGRIGYGYVYPNFNSAVRYTTPDFNGLNMSLGVYDPAKFGPVYDHDNDATTATIPFYNRISIPRLEGEVSFARTVSTRKGDVTVNTWLNGMWQRGKSNAYARTCNNANPPVCTPYIDEVNVWGIGGGVVAGWKGISMEVTGYYGRGLGTILQFSTGGKRTGNSAIGPGDSGAALRKNFGYIAEVTYDFGQGTGMGVSYGGSFTTGTEGNPVKDRNVLTDVMVWHNINDNLRVVAEYGWQRDTVGDNGETVSAKKAGEQDSHIFAVGGFFFF